jgi:3-oxoacyl-[acyl-carrier protein] reductase
MASIAIRPIAAATWPGLAGAQAGIPAPDDGGRRPESARHVFQPLAGHENRHWPRLPRVPKFNRFTTLEPTNSAILAPTSMSEEGFMGFDFTGKRVIVAGGSRGIGRSIALGFAQAGAAVSVCARSPAGLSAVKDELGAFGHPVHAAPCDLADGEAVEAYIAAAAHELGGIDILVNNASGFGGGDTEAGWETSVNVDLMATVRAGHAALPFLRKSDNPAIVNVTSISALRPSSRTQSYAAIKAAVVHYTASHALTLAADRIRVNAVAPGSIEFPGGSWEQRKSSDRQLYDRILRSVPFGRLGTPEEVAGVVLFLASPYAGWMTGQTLVVDGGQVLT